MIILLHLIRRVDNMYQISAKKIPIEHILASTRGAGRNGGPAGRAGGNQQNVNLEENANNSKNACNC